MHIFTVIALWKFKIGVCQGVSGGTKTLFWAILAYFLRFFCLFLKFSILESCYIWFTISLEYHSAYVYSWCPKYFQNQGLSGGIRGYVNSILSYFCLFSEIFWLFLQWFTLESCFIWFTIRLEYPCSYFYSGCPGKVQNRVGQGVHKPFIAIFACFLRFSVFFFHFSQWNLVIFG